MNTHRHRPSRRLSAAAAAALVAAAPLAAHAHNNSVHQNMTDFAYEALLAASLEAKGGAGLPTDVHSQLSHLAAGIPGMATLYSDAAKALPKLRALPSGLPVDPFVCLQPSFASQNGGSPLPDWKLPAGVTLAQTAMGQVRYPVSPAYGTTALDCGVADGWTPGGALSDVNPGDLTSRDHTGVVLGFWAQAVDNQTDDWHLRSSLGEALQTPAATAGIAAGTTGLISFGCLLACGLFPPACAACPVLAIVGAGVVIDKIQDTNFTDMSSSDFVGFSHFVDVKSTAAGTVLFDNKPGKFGDRAGPNGIPDTTESLVTALFDIAGVHVRQDTSAATKNYEVILGQSGGAGADFHSNTVHRSANEWESLTVGHTQLTSVYNLGMFGWQQFEGELMCGSFPASIPAPDVTLAAQNLGAPLHALGDATVPHHAAGTSGWGHRPYEDAMEFVYDEVIGTNDRNVSLGVLSQAMSRALTWRKFITDWRAAHPGVGNDVPVRDMITALAQSSFTKSMANQALIFDPNLSLQYKFGDTGAAKAAYETAAMKPIFKDLLIDGIAAELAFLLSSTEVLP